MHNSNSLPSSVSSEYYISDAFIYTPKIHFHFPDEAMEIHPSGIIDLDLLLIMTIIAGFILILLSFLLSRYKKRIRRLKLVEEPSKIEDLENNNKVNENNPEQPNEKPLTPDEKDFEKKKTKEVQVNYKIKDINWEEDIEKMTEKDNEPTHANEKNIDKMEETHKEKEPPEEKPKKKHKRHRHKHLRLKKAKGEETIQYENKEEEEEKKEEEEEDNNAPDIKNEENEETPQKENEKEDKNEENITYEKDNPNPSISTGIKLQKSQKENENESSNTPEDLQREVDKSSQRLNESSSRKKEMLGSHKDSQSRVKENNSNHGSRYLHKRKIIERKDTEGSKISNLSAKKLVNKQIQREMVQYTNSDRSSNDDESFQEEGDDVEEEEEVEESEDGCSTASKKVKTAK